MGLKNYSEWFLIISYSLTSLSDIEPMNENLIWNSNIHKLILQPVKGRIEIENLMNYPICIHT